MNVAASNPCDALERPRTVQSVARGLSADEVRRAWAPTALPPSVCPNLLPELADARPHV